MSAPRPTPIFTVDQYLAYEREADARHEYLDGQILGMAGESLDHGVISANTLASLVGQLRGTPCFAVTKDTKVRSGPTPMKGDSIKGLFSYPDVVVVCGEPEFHDTLRDVILNPTTIVEVLSPSTETFDQGTKFTRFRQSNPTLKDYILISQFEPRVEHHYRQADGSWQMKEYVGLEASFAIPSIRCTLRLADVYDRIKWDGE